MWTIGLVAAVVAVLMLPGVTEWMVYQRSAVARGELWRLFTAHLAHYSVSHLLNNVLVLALAGWLVEARYRTQWLSLVTVSAAGIGFAVFAFEPQIERFAGASGISLALLTYAALRGLGEDRRWRIVCTVVIVLVCAKLAAEGLFGWQLVDWQQQAGFVSLTLSHVIGAGTGLLIWLIHIAGDARGAGTSPAALVDH